MTYQSHRRSRNIAEVTVSVGIPAYNEETTISKLLKDILKEAEEGFLLKEIVVNPSGSTDGTVAMVQAVMKTDSRIKIMLDVGREGKAAALSSILIDADGDVVVFIDGDVVLEKHAVSRLVRPFHLDDKIGVCSGNTMPKEGRDDFFQFASLFVRSLHHELCFYLAGRGKIPKVNGTFYAIRRNVLDAFPRSVVSDDEYASWLAQKKGFHIAYVPEALVYTRDPHTFGGFIRWQKRIIAGQMLMRRYFNYQVPTMRVRVVVPCLLKLISKHRRKMLDLLTLFSLGILSYSLAFISLLRNEIPYTY